MHLQSRGKHRASRGCISVARRRMWQPGEGPGAHHCHHERDRISWGYIPGPGKRTGYLEGVPRAHHQYWEKHGAPWGVHFQCQEKGKKPQKCSQSPSAALGEGRSTLRVHLQGQEKDRTPQGGMSMVRRRMWHPKDAPRVHQHHWDKDAAACRCIPGAGKRTGHPKGAPRSHHQHQEGSSLGPGEGWSTRGDASLGPKEGWSTQRKQPEPFSSAWGG